MFLYYVIFELSKLGIPQNSYMVGNIDNNNTIITEFNHFKFMEYANGNLDIYFNNEKIYDNITMKHLDNFKSNLNMNTSNINNKLKNLSNKIKNHQNSNNSNSNNLNSNNSNLRRSGSAALGSPPAAPPPTMEGGRAFPTRTLPARRKLRCSATPRLRKFVKFISKFK